MSEARADFLAAAARIGARLCRDAVWAGGQCNWLGWNMEYRTSSSGGQWAPTYRAISGSLYDGAAGIGLFLARLAKLTGDPIVRETARGAFARALSAEDMLVGAGEYGYYAGLTGVARGCIDAGAALDDDALSARGCAALLRAARLAPHPQRLDVINGSAGAIPVLVAASGAGGDEVLASASAHADQLLALARRSDEGWSWDTLSAGGRYNLTGYSHGTTGIACALAELAAAVDRPDLRHAAREALRYERTHFQADQGNWPDFRDFGASDPNAAPPCMAAWCHGAPGIGIGRLRLAELMADDALIANEIEVAIQTSAASLGLALTDGMGNFSLCHGDAGNADLLLLAADRLGRPELRQAVENLGRRAIARFEDQNQPWPCGVPGAGESPNLMLGLAGIGYWFLRLYDSGSVPSILLVGDPVRVAG
ncbi:MAG TPA: lanthionine synthetase LanC family protein [Caulobacteraceae bacterium]|jgi:lantibiotic modifying enzyme|nr:lanthionine synthetase LanC family protein [Caulobacteraceae bacterium]